MVDGDELILTKKRQTYEQVMEDFVSYNSLFTSEKLVKTLKLEKQDQKVKDRIILQKIKILMKKILPPIIYFLFLFLALILTFWVMDQDFLKMLTPRVTFIILIVLIGTPVYLVGNRILEVFESANQISLADHFRQSSLLYLVLFFSSISFLIKFISPELLYGKSLISLQGFMVMLLISSTLGILINGLFLYKRKNNSKFYVV